jgi:hypothetical protein
MKRFLPYVLLLLAMPVLGKPLAREDVPKPLVPWIDWVLAGKEAAQCPMLQGGSGNAVCVWPGRLSLQLTQKGGRMQQAWRLFADGWAVLPGGAKRWPQGVTVDGKPALVVERNGQPQIYLKRGSRSITASFRWDSLPEMLEVPLESGVVALQVRGKSVAFPVRDGNGRLWVQKRRAVEKSKARLEVVVHRKVIDSIPLRLETRVQLKVSGKSREVLLGKALPSGFIPVALQSPLPARLETNGRLRVQVRPGTWDLTLKARHDGRVVALNLEDAGGPWDKDEVWVFESRNQLRVVSVEGPAPVDPQQTELPGQWRGFPAYLMAAGTEMKLVERRRGDADPQPDRLKLRRTFWLDFDGNGYSVQDVITGKLNRGWRLEMAPRTTLGRVAVGGQDQFITSLSKDGAAGIEVRQKSVQLSADSRIEHASGRIPAVGWNHDFDHLSATLQLPAGWRLFHASGVDQASPTWINSWSLLDFFLVLMIAISVAKLWGNAWGAAALGAVVLAWHEPAAPRFIWLAVLACEALARKLPEGKVQRAAVLARGGVWALLLLIVLPFAVVQTRQALYPQLEGRGSRSTIMMLSRLDNASMNANTPQAVPMAEIEGMASEEDAFSDHKEVKAKRRGRKGSRVRQALYASKAAGLGGMAQTYRPDPNSKVNTGPGLPAWTWRSIRLSWQGPVKKDQSIRLWLLSPRCRLFLTVLRLGLVSLLLLLLFGLPLKDWFASLRQEGGIKKAWSWLLPILLLSPWVTAEAQSTFPPPAMLNELQNRLTEKAACAPRCAESPRLAVDVAGNTLRLRFAVHAVAATAVPLPGGAKQWTPATVLVDGAAAVGLQRTPDGRLWVPLRKGVHTLQLAGPLPDIETVQIPLPLKSRRVEAKVSGWVLDGVHEDGLADGTLQLTRLRTSRGQRKSLEPGHLPPFVKITRTLNLGLSWTVTTTVSRVSPKGSAIVLAIPLLPGESVTTEKVRVEKNKALVNMGPRGRRVSWTSTLKPMAELTLTAPEEKAWVEHWKLLASPMWHAEVAGIPTVFGQQGGPVRIRQWRPWPGESVTLNIARPEGVAGQTLTIDKASLELKPGLRAADAKLDVSLRSSRGGQHTFTLPESADLQSVKIDGNVQPIRQEGRKVTVPIRPGGHSVSLEWRQEGGVGLLYRTPEIDLGAASVNSGLQVHMPRKRWTLFLGGPQLGPAVLFWPLLSVFLAVSIGLGRVGLTPLKWGQWFLLSLGLTQTPIPAAMFIAGWLLTLGWRKAKPCKNDLLFNLVQVALAWFTLAALVCLFTSITRGLLGYPDMQISGNGSSAHTLLWYQDRTGMQLPRAWVLSVPLLVYRLAMLAWALWLASALIQWLKWGWSCFSEGGLWRQKKPAATPPPPKP